MTLLDAGPGALPSTAEPAIRGPNFLAALAVDAVVEQHLEASRVTGGTPTSYARGRGVGGSSLVNAMVALDASASYMPGCSAGELSAARRGVALSIEPVTADELGPVDRALSSAAVDTERAALTRRDGRRHTSADAYLAPAGDRANLDIRADTHVDRVVVEGRRAVGVVTSAGDELVADHVVLAAGAIHSPAILLRSGVAVAGVGEGLQDHPSVTFTLQLDASSSATGELVIGSVLRRGALQALPMNHLGDPGSPYAALLVAHMTPAGRAGTVRLRSDDPSDPPLVDFALLDDPRDAEALRAGASVGIELLGAAPFREIVEQVYVDAHGTTLDQMASGDVESWVRTAVGDYVHAAGTCAMGTVVDADGAVAGYERLHVCDASIFPRIPDVNTHLPTTVLAEVIAARWRRSERRSGDD